MGNLMKFSHLTDTILLFGDEFDNFQTKLIRVGHNLHLKIGVQVFGCRSLKPIIYLIEQEEISLMDVFSQFDKLHAKLPTSYQFPHSKNAVQPKALMKN